MDRQEHQRRRARAGNEEYREGFEARRRAVSEMDAGRDGRADARRSTSGAEVEWEERSDMRRRSVSDREMRAEQARPRRTSPGRTIPPRRSASQYRERAGAEDLDEAYGNRDYYYDDEIPKDARHGSEMDEYRADARGDFDDEEEPAGVRRDFNADRAGAMPDNAGFADDFYENADGRRHVQGGRSAGNVRHEDMHGGRGRALHRRGVPRKKRTGWRIFAVVAAIALLFVAYSFVKPLLGGRYWTVAVFGVDSRDGGLEKGALSDVEMVASIDRRTGDIRLISVYRDTYLKINDEGDYHKINEAYFKGGHKQAVKALEENLDLEIDDYVTFNWAAVAKAINELGGIDLEISDAEFSYINAFITETVNSTGIGSVQLEHAGMNHLDGVQAVAYGRLRLMDTDFNRTARQRKVIGLAMQKAKEADAGKLVNLARAILPELSTSIDVTDVVGIARNIAKYNIADSDGFPFARKTMNIGKLDCVVPTTLESNVVTLHQKLYGVENYTPSETVRKISQHIGEVSGLTEPGENAPAAGTGGGVKHKDKTPAQTAAPTQGSEAETETQEESTEETEETEEESETSEKEKETEETAETREEETECGSAKGPGETEVGPGVTPESSVSPEKEETERPKETAAQKPQQSSQTPEQEKTEEETRPTAPGGEISDGSDKGPGVA